MKIPAKGLTGEVLLREAVTEFRAIIDLLRGALSKKLYPLQNDFWLDIDAVYPDRVIASKDGKHFQFTYSIDAQNQVVLGEPIEVREDYVPLIEAVQSIVRNGSSVFLEAVGEKESGKWLIRVIQAGASQNKNFYPDAVLREAAPSFNGARVFLKTDDEHLKGVGKAVKNLLGGLSDSQFVEGASLDTGEITAVFSLMEPDGEVAVKLREAYQRGMSDLFGFSIDVEGTAKTKTVGGVKLREAKSITKVHSVDLIVEPGAGGQLIRMMEAVDTDPQSPNHTATPKEQDTMKTRMLEAIKKAKPATYALIDPETITDEQLEQTYREATATDTTSPAVAEVQEKLRMIEAKSVMRLAITESTLPAAAKEKLRTQFEATENFTEAMVTEAITKEREYLSKFVESGKPVIHFDEAGRVEDTSIQMADMLDAFFNPSHKNHRDVRSFKECYIQFTGDRLVTGDMRNADRARMREAAGSSFTESLDSGVWANALGNSMTRAMQANYEEATDLQSWRKLVSIVPLSDFRTQERVRIGGYGNLPLVGERDPYASLTSPGDAKATYAAAKRGGTEDVTLEMVKNDDVGAIRQIPIGLAQAAANTLYEFVFDFFRTNAPAADGLALFHASHSNLFTAALSNAEFAAHRLSMLKQTRAGSGKRMAVGPGFLLVPFDLQELAFNLFIRNQNLDKTFVQSINPEVIPVSYWTDPTDWVTVADPKKFRTIELGFLDGKEEPEMFVQDSPTSGSMFNNDTITYKIRHIYGGNLLVDAEKATTKAVVAG